MNVYFSGLLLFLIANNNHTSVIFAQTDYCIEPSSDNSLGTERQL